ncbi:MAG: ribosome-recycling factor [Oceanospirillaceae bacterium]|jgi:ribosome recycling factor|uniref:ribosome recycling factor n=1 Tax=Marinobacterium litorale TaxID=404770 RepID=UPI00040CB008|nr:ribosome recycling factor [Marinobacterium litorale]MBS98208.1 ribosome-recycling factor [Oceanospirillaceae bacterium]
MISEIVSDAEGRMKKSIESLTEHFKKIRTGRASPAILDSVQVSYYGSMVPIQQVANVSVEDARTLMINPWEKKMVPEVEKAIMKSDLGLNPATNGDIIRVPMPALTEETRKGYIRQARLEAENARVAIRNIRRDANGDFKDLLKEKEITEDENRRGEDQIQKITDKYVGEVDALLAQKETDLMEI